MMEIESGRPGPERPEPSARTVTVDRTWDDPNLPEQFEATALQVIYKGVHKTGGPSGPSFLTFEGKGFHISVPREKIPNLSNLQVGDPIQVVKLDWQGAAYGGDGIIAVTNLRTGESANYGTWQKRRRERT